MEILDTYVKENSYDLSHGIKKFENPDFLNCLLDIIEKEAKERRMFLSSIIIIDNHIKVIGGYGIKDEDTFEYDFYIDSKTCSEVFDKLLERILTSSYKKKICSIFDITFFNEKSNYEMIITLKNRVLNNISITLKYSRISDLLCALELFRKKTHEFNNDDLESEIRNLDEETLQERFRRGLIRLIIN